MTKASEGKPARALARQYGRYGNRKIAEQQVQASWVVNDKWAVLSGPCG